MSSLSSADMVRKVFLERELDLISSKTFSYGAWCADETYHFVSRYIREELKKLNE